MPEMLGDRSTKVTDNHNMDTSTESEQFGGTSESPDLEGSGTPRELNPTIPYGLAISCVGIVANGLALVVIIRFTKMRKRLSGLLIYNQTLVDFCTCLVQVAYDLIEIYADTQRVPVGGLAGELYCRIFFEKLFLIGFITASTINLVVLTIERYLCVVHPIFHKTHCRVNHGRPLLAIIWLLGVFLCAIWTIPSSQVIGQKCYPYFKANTSHAWRLANQIFVSCQYLFVPVLVMVYCYGRMACNRARSNVSTGGGAAPAAPTGAAKMSRTQLSLLKTMVIVCVCFVVCWTGSVITWLLFLAGNIQEDELQDALFYPTILRLANMSINPFIYILQYNEFRNGIKKMKKRVHHNNHQSFVMTAAATAESTV